MGGVDDGVLWFISGLYIIEKCWEPQVLCFITQWRTATRTIV